ncbi:MAG: DUF58 domain-containing protein, partial [Muribaculaceae bacterium]|nr:DUF58 domain-containing protein [Muribaculaceae bacterium]
MFIAYIILTLSIGLFHILYKGDLSFIILAFLVILPAVTFIVLAVQTRLLKIDISADDAASERGKPAAVNITLRNPTFLPIAACKISVKYRSVHMSETPVKAGYEKYSAAVPVKQRTAETVTVSITPEHCGTVEFRIKSLRLSDFLGFSFLLRKINFSGKVIVLPNAFPINAELENGVADGTDSAVFSAVKPGDDPSEIFQLREYRDGDRHNRIHWKLSSRSETFIVKELSRPVNSKIMILCDFSGCGSADRADGVLDAAMTLSSFFVRNGAV